MEITPNIIEDLARDIYNKALEIVVEEAGVSLDRLCKLAKADNEGRCEILLCKPGDVVYCLEYWPARLCERYVYGYQFNVSENGAEALFEIRDSSENCCWWYELEQFGEDIFLSKEAAGVKLSEQMEKEQEATP